MKLTEAICSTVDSIEAARFLGLKNAKTLYHWRKKGVGPRYMSYGRLIRYDLADLAEWQASRVVGEASDRNWERGRKSKAAARAEGKSRGAPLLP